MVATAPMTMTAAAMATKTHRARRLDTIVPVMASAVVPAGETGGGATGPADATPASGGADAVPGWSGAPHLGQTVAPLPCQVQHFRQTARPILR